MQLISTTFFLLGVVHVVSCLGFVFANFLLQIPFAFVVRFLFLDLQVLTTFPLEILVSSAQIWPPVLKVSVIFALPNALKSLQSLFLRPLLSRLFWSNCSWFFFIFVLQILAASVVLWLSVLQVVSIFALQFQLIFGTALGNFFPKDYFFLGGFFFNKVVQICAVFRCSFCYIAVYSPSWF